MALSACGGDIGGANTTSGPAGNARTATSAESMALLCDEINGGGTQAKVADGACPQCARDESLSIDGLMATFAALGRGPDLGPVALAARAQPGVVFPAGSTAGVVLSVDTPYSLVDVQIALAYRAEFVAKRCETVVFDNAEDLSILTADGPALFDTVEVTVFPSSSGTCDAVAQSTESGVVSVRVHEFCSAVGPG